MQFRSRRFSHKEVFTPTDGVSDVSYPITPTFTFAKALHCVALVMCLWFSSNAIAQTAFWSDSFESTDPSTCNGCGGVARSANFANFYCGLASTSYFDLSSYLSPTSLSFGDYSGKHLDDFWAGENIDAGNFCVENSQSANQKITWSNINISGRSSISFKGLFAANSTGLSTVWEGSAFGTLPQDYVIVEYSIDGGPWTKALAFYARSSIQSSSLSQDTNGDLIGDGNVLTRVFSEFTANIPGTGNNLSLRLSAHSDQLNEEFAIDNFRLLTNPPSLTATQSQVNTSCNGGCNGSASVVASGGVAPYTYAWSPSGGNAATASGLCAGNYTCTITDFASSTITKTFSITQPSAIVVSAASQTNIPCFDFNFGAASINLPTGGTAPYTYNWTPGNPTGDGTRSVTGLSAGTWTCTVTDANSCTKTKTFNITQPAAIAVSAASQTNVSCNGGNDGAASINTPTGGTPGYTYNWTPGAPTGDGTGSVTGLSAGTWTCAVTDANGCIETTAVLIGTLNTSSTPITAVSVPSSNCPNTYVTLTASGGISGTGSTIKWYSGPNGTGTLLGTGNSIIVSPSLTTTYYVRREGLCNTTSDFSVVVNVKRFIYAANGVSSSAYCTDNSGWNHFYVGDEIILSVRGNLSSAGTITATIQDNDAYYFSPGSSGTTSCSCPVELGEVQFEMERNWNLNLDGGSLSGLYEVRFYYEPSERSAVITAASNWITAYADCGYTYKYNAGSQGLFWFKNQGSAYTAPDYDDDPTFFLLSNGGNGTTPNGINYTTLPGLTSFSGGSGAIILVPDPLLPIPSQATETITACGSYAWHDSTYTASTNTATWIGTNAAGCDSTVTLNLTITNSPTASITGNTSFCAGQNTILSANATSGGGSVKAIASGEFHSLFLKNDGTVWATGLNGFGPFGDGTNLNKNTPVQVSGLSGITDIAAGAYHSLFLKNDGTVWVTGRNEGGQLGDGTNVNKNTPVQVSGLSGITAIAGGEEHSLFLKNDGTVWATGLNTFGQLGDGTNVNKNTPVQVSGLSSITGIAAGYIHSLFLKNDGTVWATGGNISGQLGDGTNVNKNTPVQVSGLSGITGIAAGYSHSLFLKNDGTVWAAGWNFYGQLGDGTTVGKITPIQVTGLSGITGIAAGYAHSLFSKNDGTLRTTGYNDDGQLGDGTNVNKSTPAEVNSLSGITSNAGGYAHSLFLKNDGSVWATGNNYFGQLGDGTNVNKNSPVSVSIFDVAITSYQWKLNGSDIAGANNATYTASAAGNYTVVVTNSNGCSVTSESVNVTVNQPSYTTETIVACGSYEWHGTTYTSSNNTDTWTGQNAAGCDSTVTLNLTINTIPTITCPSNITVDNDPGICGAVVSFGSATTIGSPAPVLSYSHASGSLFPIGTTTVAATATNICGAPTCTFTVTVNDTQAPVITCPANITNVISTSAAGAVINYTTPVGTDNCTGAVTTRTAGLASGDTFPIGVTTVTHRVTDAAGLTAECSFDVTVTGVAPQIACPDNIIVSNDAGQCGAAVTFAATETVGIPAAVITYSIASGSNFSVGTTQVTATATNAVGSSSCTFDVIVNDTEAPSITCPIAVTVNANEGQCYATNVLLGLSLPIAIINPDFEILYKAGSTSVTSPLLGIGKFAYGITNSNMAGPTVTFSDGSTGNRFDFPGWTFNAPNSLAMGITNENSNFGIGRNMITFINGETFGGGSAEKTMSQTLAENLQQNTTYTLTADFGWRNDNSVASPPVLRLYAGATLLTPIASNSPALVRGSFVTYTRTYLINNNAISGPLRIEFGIDANTNAPQLNTDHITLSKALATDNCAIATVIPTLNGNPVTAATQFPVGNNTVIWTATDTASNTVTCNQTISVNDTQAPVISCQANITGVVATSAAGAVVNYTTPVGTDNCTGATTSRTLGLASGATFPIGVTTVTHRVTDAAGLTAECSFTVTVLVTNTTTITACDSYTWPVNGQTYTASGTHTLNAGATAFFNSLSGLTSAVSTAGYTLSATETFNSIAAGYATSLTGNFGAGSPTWTAIAPLNGLYIFPAGGSRTLSTYNEEPLTISFNPGVTSVGANFFLTLGDFVTVSGTITLTLSDGSIQSFYTNTTNSFGGFVSHGAYITSITITTSNDYVTVDNLVVSTGTINAYVSEELNLTINHPSSSTETIVACGSYDWKGASYTTSNNTATWTGENAAGCDSTVTLNLTINQPSYATETITACGSYAWHDSTYTASTNTATWTGENAAGCDSIVTLDLTINTLPTIICPDNITVNNMPGQCGANVTFEATATGTPTPAITYSPTSGSFFPVGTTTVTAIATNSCGEDTCTFTVTVNDTQAPVWSSSPFEINNGSLVTDPGAGSGGADASAILGITFGYGNQISSNNRVADDFVISEANGFTINEVVVYGYQTGSGTTSTLDNVNLRIWNGEPDNGGTVIWGDVSTNRLISSTFSGIYRVTPSTLTDTARPIMKNTLAVGGLHLPAGTYWLDWQVGGSDALSGPWACPNTLNGNGKKSYNGSAFATIYDGDTAAGFPFEVMGNTTPSAEPGLCGTIVNYLTPSASDNCTVTISQTAGLPSGSMFPVGITTNTFTATDTAGNTSTTSFDITVSDTQAPTISCQGDITGVLATSAAGAVVNYTTPVGTDNCTGAFTTRTDGLASGDTFPIGTTTVTHLVTDAAGLTAECSFDVTVVVVAPAIICPDNITLNNTAGQCGTAVTFAATETVGIPASVITYSIASGSNFSVGTTQVTATATNAVGSSSCTFDVIVNDREKPVITCPANISATSNIGCATAVVVATATATDNCGVDNVSGVRSDALALNALYPVGVTTITWTATDIYGNDSSICEQTVTVTGQQAVASISSQTICTGSPMTDITISGGVLGTTYSWTRDNGANVTGIATSGSGDISGGILTNSTNVPVTVTFTITPNYDGCAGTPITAIVIVNPKAETPVISGNAPFCQGSSVTLDAGSGYASYSWSNGATTQTTAVSNATPVSVTVTNAAGCSGTSASVTPTVNALSTAPTSITSSVVFALAGTNFTLSVNGGSLGTGASWKWYTGSCGGTLIGTGASISVSQTANTTYFVRAEGTCNTTACATITVSSQCGATGVTSSAGTTAICAGSPVTLTVIGSLSPGAQWRWDDECDNDDDGTNTTVSTFTVSPTSTKTYYVRSVGGLCGLTACVPVTVNVIAKPATPGTISGSASVCPSTSVTYTIAAVAGATSYTWTAPTNATLVSAQGGTSMTVSYASAFTSGTLKVKANNCSGSSSDKSLTIAKQVAPATPGNISGASAPCKGSTQTYSTSAVSSATSYTWTLPTGVSFVSGTSQTGTSIQVVVASTFNSGTLSVKANNCGGSSSNRTTTLTGQSAPTAPGTISGPSSVTQNTANNTFSVSNVAGMTYNWSVPAGCTITLGQGTSSIKVTWGTVAGTVSVTRNNGCGNSVASTKSVSVKRSEEAEADAGMEGARTEETVETLVTATDALNTIAVYPNPTTGEARITFNTTTAGKYAMSIVDLQGRVINSTSGAATEGNNTLDINLSNCSNGVYMIHLMHNDTLQTLRLVKM